MAGDLGRPRIHPSYAAEVGRVAYLWGWPLVNMHNRRVFLEQLPGPCLMSGIVPAGPPGHIGMLRDYIRPEERLVACPNQDVVYGFGALDAQRGPSVVQVPDFGDRFWVYQAVDQRTDSFVELGKMYGTPPGHYLLAPTGWEGEVPEGIIKVFRYDTRVAVVIPRVFMDDTEADRVAVGPLVDQITVYPLEDYDGTMKTVDWGGVPSFGEEADSGGETETQWVDPATFFDVLGEVLEEVPPRAGEEALYDWFRPVLEAASREPQIAAVLKQAAMDADATVDELFEFRHYGLPAGHFWSTQRSGAAFGTDYLMRTAVGKSNIFVNTANETTYYYLDLDAAGERLDGRHTYSVHFAAERIPPVRGFWSLTVYNKHHFFHPNPLDRYSLGTKNQHLHVGADGSLTLTAGGDAPSDPAQLSNWLPAPADEFTLYLRAYWPEQSIVDGVWEPPAVVRIDTA
ncbi:DUF1214 domain-containing protein [Actinomycetospora endophytica]|uniref:DUF1214 domain-containing protein n=1 Tax=Actinomycetospora endophytica TaxID=2291215 RepID=A0ABS8P943_9PSEU|nr:DUF1214 domain-containing protein [Actinomycetospora endophytica]MCD2194791.1 DUF1214 domain-containing protein [Actinomycetospora endophytica]